jgi:hypothetical protein
VQFGLVGGALALYLTAIVGWPLTFFAHRRRAKERPLRARLARWAAGLFGLLFITLLVGLGLTLSDYMQLAAGLTPQARALTSLAPLMALLAGATLVFAVLAWRRSDWTVGARIHYTLITVAILAVTWWLAFWNLLF